MGGQMNAFHKKIPIICLIVYCVLYCGCCSAPSNLSSQYVVVTKAMLDTELYFSPSDVFSGYTDDKELSRKNGGSTDITGFPVHVCNRDLFGEKIDRLRLIVKEALGTSKEIPIFLDPSFSISYSIESRKERNRSIDLGGGEESTTVQLPANYWMSFRDAISYICGHLGAQWCLENGHILIEKVNSDENRNQPRKKVDASMEDPFERAMR